MCYSFEASITAAAGLALAGYGMMSKALSCDRRMLVFAAFPMVFAIHQLTEAGAWLTLHDREVGQQFRYLYTLIAFALWPVLTPYAAAHAEADPERRRLWLVMTGVGAAVAAYLIARLAGSDGIDLQVVRHSLAYDPLFERPPLLVHFLYVTLTVVPLVASRRRGVALFGWAVLATFVLALVENRAAWYSVWCMAAALFSFILALAIGERSSELDELQTER